MLFIKPKKEKQYNFPTLNMEWGTWVCFQLPNNIDAEVMKKYLKHIKSDYKKSLFQRPVERFKLVNLTITNPILHSNKKLSTLIKKYHKEELLSLSSFVENSLEISTNTRLNHLGWSKRIYFWYALNRGRIDLLFIMNSGLDPLGVDGLYAMVKKDLS